MYVHMRVCECVYGCVSESVCIHSIHSHNIVASITRCYLFLCLCVPVPVWTVCVPVCATGGATFDVSDEARKALKGT